MMPGLPVRWLLVLVLLLAGCTTAGPAPVPRVGTTGDPQALVLANVYAAALRSAGGPAEVVVTADPLAALDAGAVEVVPGFTGALLRVFQPATAAGHADKYVYRALAAALPEGLAASDYATAARDKPAPAVTTATAKSWGGPDLRLLPRHCRGLVVGRVAGAESPDQIGSCRLQIREFPDAAALFGALQDGRITAAWSSTAADLPEGTVLLVDSKPALVPAENVVALYRRGTLSDAQLVALNEVAGVLDTAGLAEMRRRVERGADPAAVVQDWLADNPLRR